MLLSALAKTKAKAQGIQCLSNLRQLGIAWTLYNDDNADRPPPNSGFGNTNTWVRGWLKTWAAASANPDNTNTLYLTQSLLAPYQGKSSGIWRCLADKSGLVRSISTNCWLNGDMSPDQAAGLPALFRMIRRVSDMTTPAPSHTFIFVDERADSINDGFFGVFMGYAGSSAVLINYPAGYHNGAGNLAFADGHGESHKWRDSRTNPPMIRGTYIGTSPLASPNNPDVAWLQERTTGRK